MLPSRQPVTIMEVVSSHVMHVTGLGSCVWLTMRSDLGSKARNTGVPSIPNSNWLRVLKLIPDIAQSECCSFSRPERLSKSTTCISPVVNPQARTLSAIKVIAEGHAHSVSISKIKARLLISNSESRFLFPLMDNKLSRL